MGNFRTLVHITADEVDMLNKSDNNRANCNVFDHFPAPQRPRKQSTIFRSCGGQK